MLKTYIFMTVKTYFSKSLNNEYRTDIPESKLDQPAPVSPTKNKTSIIHLAVMMSFSYITRDNENNHKRMI